MERTCVSQLKSKDVTRESPRAPISCRLNGIEVFVLFAIPVELSQDLIFQERLSRSTISQHGHTSC